MILAMHSDSASWHDVKGIDLFSMTDAPAVL